MQVLQPLAANLARTSDFPADPLLTVPFASRFSRRRLLATGLSLVALAATPRVGLAASEQYVVQPGDTLWDIAVAHDVDLDRLMAANRLYAGSILNIGQRLLIPSESTTGSPADPAPEPPDNAEAATSRPAVAQAPYRSQFDGSAYADSNCGPATLGMFLGHYGATVSTATLRESANRQMGSWSPNNGTSWEALAAAASAQGFGAVGLYGASGRYRNWDLADLIGDDPIACPAMLLVYFRGLPRHATSGYYGDHYILVLGRDESGAVVFHDPAFRDGSGAYGKMTAEQLDRAWSRTSVGLVRTAMGLTRA